MRKSTIRKMTKRPVTRKGAKLLNQLNSVARRLQSWLPDVESKEIDSNALANILSAAESYKPTSANLQAEIEKYLEMELAIIPDEHGFHMGDMTMANLATHIIDWIFKPKTERDQQYPETRENELFPLREESKP